MLVPGRITQGTTIRIPVNFQNDEDEDVDPDTVTFKVINPEGVITTYVFGTDAELQTTSEGDYYVDVTADKPGRWTYRWETTGSNQNLATEGDFVVQVSPFYDNCGWDAYR